MRHGRFGVVLLQLGTPDAPTAPALRRYLRQFLGDRRVIDLNRVLWWLILNLAVLPRRPKRSAELYRRIWTAEGSPLLVTARAQAAGLAAALEARLGERMPVAVAMRYGEPSTSRAVEELLAQGVDRLIAFPMYPQYASATTGSSLEELFTVLGRLRVVPSVRVVPPYFDDPAHIEALRAVTAESLARLPFEPERVLVSFHGLPARYVAEGDPYQTHCEATVERLAAAMGWPREKILLVYQSLFGREVWLQPYADVTLKALPSQGVSRVAVMCPGFTADCLETIEEMGMTNRELFLGSGGSEYHLVPCLNDHPAWIDAMASIVEREAAGWARGEGPDHAPRSLAAAARA
ncbi:MAG TPA: ferrochelatase [Vicinamibacterales bacterium]